MTSSKNIASLAFVMALAWNNAQAQTGVPFVFEPNTPARAEEINANFAVLGQAIDGTSVRVFEREFADPAGKVSCNDDEIIIGGGCFCTGSPDNGKNFGAVYSCIAERDRVSYLGGCIPTALYDPDLAPSSIMVQAVCVSTLGMDPAVAKALTSSTDSNSGVSSFHQLKTIIKQYTDKMKQ